ncbi:hypothetical protein ABH924_004624 [Arthrobacter sp. GAS37]|uniref:hypothetical protein n=1 Tax=Arthrobacter sp. GAS37 TaxID=3156261 RepID=UPI0038385021
MQKLVLALQAPPAVEFETDWNATAWILWWAFVAVGIFLAWFGPALAQYRSGLWGLGAFASYIFLFFVAYPNMARHTEGPWAWGLFGLFVVAALGAWFSAVENTSGGWLPHVIGIVVTGTVAFTGIWEGLTRNAAQAHMATGDYTMGIIGLAAIVGLFIWAKARE